MADNCKLFIVLGMHKSGTTLVSQILHSSGINMGFDLNKKRFEYSGNQCESPFVNSINNRILKSQNLSSLKIGKHLYLYEDKNIYEDIRTYLEKASQYRLSGIKDPRMCLTYSVWKKFLPKHALILVYRLPIQTWKHYKKMSRFNQLWFVDFFKRYFEYLDAMIKILKKFDGPVFIVNYNHFMKMDCDFKKLENFIGKKLEDKRDYSMYIQRLETTPLYTIQKKIAASVLGIDVDEIYSKMHYYYNQQKI